jgi:hypothetical protein
MIANRVSTCGMVTTEHEGTSRQQAAGQPGDHNAAREARTECAGKLITSCAGAGPTETSRHLPWE